jgi:hypothetical protein
MSVCVCARCRRRGSQTLFESHDYQWICLAVRPFAQFTYDLHRLCHTIYHCMHDDAELGIPLAILTFGVYMLDKHGW